MTDESSCRLYLITPPAIDLGAFAEDLVAALDGGDVACLQLRLKGAGDDDVRRAVERLMPLAHARDVAFLINDRPDIAFEMGADGVHVGADDTPYPEARAIVGDDAIVGVSCYDSRQRAMELGDAGADYVAFGAFFPTATKTPKTSVTPDVIEIWSSMTTVPCVAIGGITVENCGPLVRAGADFLAVVNGVWGREGGPGAAVAAFERAIAANRPS
ncbi:thiamine phosphate synthase [Minwuia thermotolerans]|uniref:Thiamine-phosphate synthase n=1 Tax=Minwuia thermotolerans TaxID=2056226 RepID=A0A2M9FZH9_9PROT|nr:thiamine phosphate synthase [Minwuia thermotolerans]PJK28877.1 thiamine phosphate synthase [Minwuia thermotolerans]